jgi:hypothetical protein
VDGRDAGGALLAAGAPGDVLFELGHTQAALACMLSKGTRTLPTRRTAVTLLSARLAIALGAQGARCGFLVRRIRGGRLYWRCDWSCLGVLPTTGCL